MLEHRVVAEEKKIKLVNGIPKGTMLTADPILFLVVLTNLISNALKFCSEGDEIAVEIPENMVNTIAVRDSGPGISEKIVPDLFKHEIKTTTVGTMGELGTGLGLPYFHDIVSAHGGRIWVESKVGEGSTFYVELSDRE
jgi:signal transduction histidine kinase